MHIQKFLMNLGNMILSYLSDDIESDKVPHRHEWVSQYSVGAYWDGDRYEVVKCITCGSEGKTWRGMTKATKLTELYMSLPHKHDWCFEYRGGRKEGADKNTPMSVIVSCECGKWAVRHYGETEYILLEGKNNKI